MPTLTSTAILALAAACQNVVAPSIIAGIAMHESGGNTAAVHVNKDGTKDAGLMQINQANWAWLGLVDPFDSCQSIAAAAKLLASYSRYNTGSPTAGMDYAKRVTAAVRAVKSGSGAADTAPPQTPCAASWDAWALAACSHHKPGE